MVDIGCDPEEVHNLVLVPQYSKADYIISTSSSDNIAESVTAKPRGETQRSKSADLESTALKILEYTGLNGKKLERRLKDFTLYNRGKGLYDEHDVIKKLVLINDPIHGAIKLHPLLEKIMNTPEFYRLKNVKQLGGVCHVYPGANHTRFEHSLGVSFIAGKFISHLRDQHPSESKIDEKDILCVKVAGLCHDLGQGPYSHVFETMVVKDIIGEQAMPKRWCTKMSVLIFRKILRDNSKVLSSFVRSGLSKTDVQFIEEMIDHDEESKFHPQGRKDEKQRFLYEIVSNRATEVDVDKWDCFARDCHYLGITINFQWQRLMELGYIVGGKGEQKRRIGFRNKEVNDIYEMFHTQWCLTLKAYKHKTVHAIEMMIAKAIFLCKDIELIHLHPVRGDFESDSEASEDEHFDSKCGESKTVRTVSVRDAVQSAMKAIKENRPDDLQGYLALNDFIIEQILQASTHGHKQMILCEETSESNSQWKRLAEAQELLHRIENRMLYKLAECKIFSTHRKEVSNEKAMIVHNLQELIKEDKPRARIAEKSDNQFSAEDIHVEMVKITFGSEDDIDPVKNVLFVPKHDLTRPNPNEFEKASPLVRPEEFTEYQLRVFTTKKGLKKAIVKDAVTSWYSSETEVFAKSVKTEFPHDIIGAIQHQECGPDGTNIELKEHDIQINIPAGAVHKRVEIEFAVCLSGPFRFPANRRPVSPILWICSREAIKKFNKPIEVIIPHIFPELLDHEITELQLGFVKADHSIDYDILDDGSRSYFFREITGSGSQLQSGYGTLNLDHCCYLCILSNDINRSITTKAQYCLSQFQLMKESRSVVIFCATYFLKTCLEALRSQFPCGVPLHIPPKKFKFHDPLDDQCLIVSCEPGEIKVTANPISCKILASEIDFWKHKENGEDSLRLQHDYKMYPPRVTFEVDNTTADTFKLKFTFTGCPESYDLNTEIMFPLSPDPFIPHPVQVPQSLRAGHGLSINAQSTYPKFNVANLNALAWNSHEGRRETYSVLNAIKHEWRIIGEILGIELSTLLSYKKQNKLPRDCLIEIFHEWREKFSQDENMSYKHNWEGLYTLLQDIKQSEQAHKLLDILYNRFGYKLQVSE